MSKFVISYAQNREDIIIGAFFKDTPKGFYVDVGANHPFYHSITKNFYDKGWSGINIEPNPMLMSQIIEHRKRDINLQVGIGDKSGEFKLRVYHSKDGLEGISTFSKNMKNQYSINETEDTKKFDDISAKVVTLKEMFANNKIKHIHFMKIDVEGYEKEVIDGNDWKKYRPELICIESNHVFDDWKQTLIRNKYKLVFNDGLNDYFLREESMRRIDLFDYAEVFLSETPVITHDFAEKISSLQKKIAAQRKELKFVQGLADARQYEMERLSKEVSELKSKYEEISSLKRHINMKLKSKFKEQSK